MLRYKTDTTWFNCLLRHPGRKRSVSIITLEPGWGICEMRTFAEALKQLCWVNKPINCPIH